MLFDPCALMYYDVLKCKDHWLKNSSKLQLSLSIIKLKIFLYCDGSQHCVSNLIKLVKGKFCVFFSLKKKKLYFSVSVVLIKVVISVPLMNISHTQQKRINVSKTHACSGITGNTPWMLTRAYPSCELCTFACKTEQLLEFAVHEQRLYPEPTCKRTVLADLGDW